MIYNLVWKIEKSERVEASSKKEAQNVLENLDCVYDGDYIEDSFEIIKIEETPL